jgi:glycosyltransferase involved in cell wall biosynthesis
MSHAAQKATPMRIALLSWESRHSIAVGGLAEHVSELATTLARRGHDVHVFTRMGPGQSGYERVNGVQYHRCRYDGHPDFVTDNERMCRSFVWHLGEVEPQLAQPFDIIHGHDWLTAKALMQAKDERGCHTVLTMHSTEFGRCGNQLCDGLSWRIRQVEWEGTYVAERVICVSRALQAEVRQLYATPVDKMHVIYNGVDVRRFDAEIDVGSVRARYAVGLDDPLVLFAGRLAWQKGPDLLVDALPGVLHHHPQAKFVFAGDGHMRHGLEERVAAIGVAPSTRFLGYREGTELVSLFKGADLVCVPSRNEPFGIVILEAWSASKPVVATRQGGPAELVRNEDTGLTVSDNVGSIGWGISRLLADTRGGRRMGRNGRREAETRFSWDTIAAATEGVYRSIVHRTTTGENPVAGLYTEEAEMAQQRSDKPTRRTAKARTTSTSPKPARSAVTSKTVKQVTGMAEPTQDDVRQRAYEIYLARNDRPGDPVADWLQAERELRSQLRT